MTQTLTTEQLRVRAESLGLDFFIEQRAGVWVKEWNTGACVTANAQEVEMWLLLANREAQPVACDIERIKRHALPAGECPRQSQVVLLSSLQRLLTAPPVPAVPECFLTLLKHAGGMAMGTDWNSGTAAKYHRTKLCEAVGACRAAMLTQPVSSGYTLPDGWIACSERMPELDKRVLLYFGSYDGHIEDGCIGDDGDGPYHYFFDGDSLQQEPTHWMPLPAAPKGGNG